MTLTSSPAGPVTLEKLFSLLVPRYLIGKLGIMILEGLNEMPAGRITLLAWDRLSLACCELSPPPPLLGASHTGVFTMVHLNVCSLMDDVVASIVLPKHLENVLFI